MRESGGGLGRKESWKHRCAGIEFECCCGVFHVRRVSPLCNIDHSTLGWPAMRLISPIKSNRAAREASTKIIQNVYASRKAPCSLAHKTHTHTESDPYIPTCVPTFRRTPPSWRYHWAGIVHPFFDISASTDSFYSIVHKRYSSV